MSQMCNNFTQHGNCRFGDTCSYRHGPNDPRDLNAIAKTKPCPNFQRGACRFGASCMYAHAGVSGTGAAGAPPGAVRGKGGKGKGRGRGKGGKGGRGGGRGRPGPIVTVVPHHLSDDGLKVFIENRARAKLEHQKIDIFKDLLARGNKGSSWRGFDDRLDEFVSFGSTGLRNMIMAITGKSQDKKDTLWIFSYEPNIGKQETLVKELRASKQQKGPGGTFEMVNGRLKGTTDINRITIKKTKDDIIEEEAEAKRVADDAHAAATSMESLDAQVAAMALAGGGDDDEDDEGDEGDFGDMDDFM